MRIGIVGAGRIGGNVARQAVKGGHDVMVSFSRDASSLDRLASELGERASTGSPEQAMQFGEVVVLSVPWGVIPQALEQAGDLSGKVVVDTTNREERVVQWLCGDDAEAKRLVAHLIEDMGYVPVDLGGTADCEVMEAPRRPGSVYGEEWRLPQALDVVAAVADGRPIPETPTYASAAT